MENCQWNVGHKIDEKTEDNMVATEAKYDQPSPVKLYNKYRDCKRQKFVNELPRYKFAQGIYTFLFLLPGVY